MASKIRITQLYKNTLDGSNHRLLKITGIAPCANGHSLLHLGDRYTLVVHQDWVQFKTPAVGEYLAFHPSYKTSPSTSQNCFIVTEDVLKEFYHTLSETVEVAEKYVRTKADNNDYDFAVNAERKRICKILLKWDRDDGTEFPYEIDELVKKILNEEL